MENYSIYKDIAVRTQGDIYIGVVGPVRTGKSTFIKRFMEKLVIPNIENDFQKERTKDELPQSGSGKTIMTTEPKFVPNEAVEVSLDDNVRLNVRMIDCVGYMVEGALGHLENDVPRMVHTPWFDSEIPFEEAAEMGTEKVIKEHSTIGMVIVTDGSITGIEREKYSQAEIRVINELKSTGKPFIIILNSLNPTSYEAQNLKAELEDMYETAVIPLNCAQMELGDINDLLESVLFEFPVCEINVNAPEWLSELDEDHPLKMNLYDAVRDSFKGVRKIREVKNCMSNFDDYDFIKKASLDDVMLGYGSASVELQAADGLFFKILSSEAGLEIEGENKLIGLMKDYSKIKKEYQKIEYALHEVKTKGYGIVTPLMEEMSLDVPEIVKHGGRFGVKLRASAPSIHMIRADIETEIAPLVGTEKQSEELVAFLLQEFEGDPAKLWESNIFGKSLHELVSEGLHNKLFKMPEDAQLKLQETLQKIVNEGSKGLICLIL